MKKIVFFDFNKTLSACSWPQISDTFLKALLNPWSYRFKSFQLLCRTPYIAWLNHYHQDLMMGEVLRLFEVTPIATLEQVVHDTIVPLIKQHMYPKAIETLKKHQRSGDHIVILSGNLDVFLRPIADHLNVPDLICTKLKRQDNVYLPEVDGSAMVAENKRQATKDKVKTLGEPVEIISYGDSLSDIPAFEMANQAVCVNPGKRLAKLAGKRNWHIARWSAAV